MSWTKFRPLAAAALLTAAFSGCVLPGNMTGGGRGKGEPAQPSPNGYREFYVAPGVTQRFLLPVRLLGADKAYADLDLVVRDSAGVVRPGLLHVSVVLPVEDVAVTVADTLWLAAGARLLTLSTPKILFSEAHNNARLTRFEATVAPVRLRDFLRGPAYAVQLRCGNAGRLVFRAGRKATARLSSFGSAVLATPR